MKTTPSAPAAAGVTIAGTPPVLESVLTTRVESPLATKSQPVDKTQYLLISTSKTSPPETAKRPLDPSSNLTIDYSRHWIGENKSFMEAWEEASKLNEELSNLMALKRSHTASFSLHFPQLRLPLYQ